MEEKKKICCICGKRYTGFGNNAEPFKEGRCCDCCNQNWVIPGRIMRMMEEAKEKNNVSAK